MPVPAKQITVPEIEEWIHSQRETPAGLARMMGVTRATTGRWLKGYPIPLPSDKLLRLLMRGELPFGLLPPRGPGLLDLTPGEWRVIEVMRMREGFETAQAWVASKIQADLSKS